MSAEKTDALVNTEDISTEMTENTGAADGVTGSGTDAEEMQTLTEDFREGTAVLDVEDYAVSEDEDTVVSETAENADPGRTVEAVREKNDHDSGRTGLQEAVQADTARVAGASEEQAEAERSETEEPHDTAEEQEDADTEKLPEKDPETEEIKKRIRERKREKKRKERRRRTAFWTGFSIIALAIGGFMFSISGFFTVDSIEVQGNSHFTAEEIINIAHAVPGHNLLYNTDSKSIVEYLEQNPYIKTATVARKLPSTMVIQVEERAEAISFSYDDDYLIMDDEGILLKKTRTEPKITRVTGLVVTRIRLGDTVGTEDQRMFTKLLRLIRAMKDADMYFVSIDMTEYENDMSVKAYIYDKLVVKTDYESLVTNLKNGRLHRIVEKLFEDDVKRGTITIGDDGSASFEPGI